MAELDAEFIKRAFGVDGGSAMNRSAADAARWPTVEVLLSDERPSKTTAW